MKKLILLAAGLLLASETYASKARLDALQGAEFLKDTQTVFKNPAHIHSLGQYLTFEMGQTGAPGAAARAEGGFLKNESGAKFGAYLGHENAGQALLRSFNGYLDAENPVDIFYGRDNWGASFYFSRSDEKSTKEDQLTLGGRFGIIQGKTQFYGSLDAFATAKNAAGDKYKTLPALSAGFEHDAGRFYYVAQAEYANGEDKISGGGKAKLGYMGLSVGALDRSLSTAGRTLYYGAYLNYAEVKYGAKNKLLRLPLVIGIEYDLNDWAVVRASITQDFLIGYDQPAGGKKDTVGDDTVVASGLGLKYKGFIMDGVFEASNTGDVNGTQFLSKASLTYNF